MRCKLVCGTAPDIACIHHCKAWWNQGGEKIKPTYTFNIYVWLVLLHIDRLVFIPLIRKFKTEIQVNNLITYLRKCSIFRWYVSLFHWEFQGKNIAVELACPFSTARGAAHYWNRPRFRIDKAHQLVFIEHRVVRNFIENALTLHVEIFFFDLNNLMNCELLFSPHPHRPWKPL